jgi:hypothetical protein
MLATISEIESALPTTIYSGRFADGKAAGNRLPKTSVENRMTLSQPDNALRADAFNVIIVPIVGGERGQNDCGDL